MYSLVTALRSTARNEVNVLLIPEVQRIIFPTFVMKTDRSLVRLQNEWRTECRWQRRILLVQELSGCTYQVINQANERLKTTYIHESHRVYIHLLRVSE